MSWAYSSLAADPVDNPRPPDWPPEWPPPVDPDDPTVPPGGGDPSDPPTWPPGWPVDGFEDHTCTVTAPDEIQEGVAFTIEAEVEDGAGDPESALDGHVMKVSATMNGVTLQIKWSGGSFADQLYYSISNYTGSKYGIYQSIFADVDVDTDLDEVVTFTCSVISVTPNITGTDTSVVVLEEDLLWAEVATTGNITLSGEQTLDGVLTAASKVLVWKQTTAAANGLYTSAAGAWTRDNAFTAADKIYNPIIVARGQGFGQKMFVCTAANTVKLAEKVFNVRVATTANHGLSGTSNVDSQTISVGDIVLVWIQSTASQNGLYTVQSSTWTKIMDFDSDSLYKAANVALGTKWGLRTFLISASNTAKVTMSNLDVSTTGGTLAVDGSNSVALSNAFKLKLDSGSALYRLAATVQELNIYDSSSDTNARFDTVFRVLGSVLAIQTTSRFTDLTNTHTFGFKRDSVDSKWRPEESFLG